MNTIDSRIANRLFPAACSAALHNLLFRISSYGYQDWNSVFIGRWSRWQDSNLRCVSTLTPKASDLTWLAYTENVMVRVPGVEPGLLGSGPNRLPHASHPVEFVVRLRGLEPPRLSAQHPQCCASTNFATVALSWWTWTGSNRRHLPCKGSALPAELQARNGGDDGIRTHGSALQRISGLANRRDKPLCHISMFGGVGRIRTHGPLSESSAFKAAAIDHSTTTPLFRQGLHLIHRLPRLRAAHLIVLRAVARRCVSSL